MPRKRSPTPDTARKRSRVACVNCRQAKVRCDFSENPCARCTRLGIDCSVDPGFRRQNKRDKVHELEDNVQELRDLIERKNSTGLEEHNDDTVEINLTGIDNEGQTFRRPDLKGSNTRGHPPNQVDHEVIPVSRMQRNANDKLMYSLGGISLESAETDTLFSLYFKRFHKNLPILDPERQPTEYYELSTPLFWSIISVALRSRAQDDEILRILTPALCAHLWSEFGSSAKSSVNVDASNVYEIQAMLLLATWPLPNVRLWSDRSLIQANLAISSAMHIGLHRPGFDFEYARHCPGLSEAVFRERSSTWIACYCLCVSLSLAAGHAPLVPPIDWLINKVTYAVPQVIVPVELRHWAIIEKQAYDANQVFLQMNENPAAIATEPNFFTTLKAFETEFEKTHDSYMNEMSIINQVRSRGNVLLIQQLYFLADQSLKETRLGLLRAYRTSNRIVSTLLSHDNVDEILASAPWIILRIILRAAFTLERLFFSTFNKDIDHTTCKILFDSSSMLIRQMANSSENKDSQPKRVVDALKMTWKHMEKDRSLLKQDPTLKIRSRLGASMQYDCLMYYRDAVKNASDKQKGVEALAAPAEPITPTRQSFDGVTFGSSWETPPFENFLETDLSWLDDLVTSGPFPGTYDSY